MKLLTSLIALFFSFLAFSAPLMKPRAGESLLRQQLAGVFPKANKIEVTNFSTRSKIPDSARIAGLHPEVPLGQVQVEYLWEENGITQQALATAVVRVYANILVAHSNISANEPFNSANCRVESREISALRVSGYFENWKDLNEYRSRGFISHGTVIGQLQIAKPVLVNPGQIIDLVYNRSNVTISARVKALERGIYNQWIRVENPATKRVLQGRVTDFGKVNIR